MMKKLLSIALIATLMMGGATCVWAKENKKGKKNPPKQEKTLVLTNEADSINYAFGVANGVQIRTNFLQNDSNPFIFIPTLYGFT